MVHQKLWTYRDGYTEKNPALVRTLEELIRMGIRPLKLGGLSENAVAQMLHALSQRQAPEGLVSLIFGESQGYPFFVEEVFRHLLEESKVFDEAGQFRSDIEIAENEVPENVRLIVGRRLERLDEREKRALTAAAYECWRLRCVCELQAGNWVHLGLSLIAPMEFPDPAKVVPC